ncbi:MAG: cupin domain-containing protein [Oscillospiraceae bacterium]|nr:cupin domain-containing protein [Oscillospiraceae bacterium]
MKTRTEQLKEAYRLEAHPEGGWFAEVYTAPFEKDGRAMAGSIYFLLDAGGQSQFHQIDCEELWFYHEGCGVRITVLHNGRREELLLGPDCARGQRAMALIPKDAIFSAENLTADGYTFVSCVTAPKFRYEGFRLVPDSEIRERMEQQQSALCGKAQSAG